MLGRIARPKPNRELELTAEIRRCPDGRRSICDAVAEAFPGVPHKLCRFHHLREEARPIYEADRHAKVPGQEEGPAEFGRSS
jgi:hypothetical protein